MKIQLYNNTSRPKHYRSTVNLPEVAEPQTQREEDSHTGAAGRLTRRTGSHQPRYIPPV